MESILNQSQQLEDEEKRHFENVCDAYRQYATFMRCGREDRIARFTALPDTQKRFLPQSLIEGTTQFKERSNLMANAEVRNQFFLDCVLNYTGVSNSQQWQTNITKKGKEATGKGIDWVTSESISKVQSVLKSLMRDWSVEGEQERSVCYDPVINAVRKYAPLNQKSTKKVCVPGAGLGRLALELRSYGYEVCA